MPILDFRFKRHMKLWEEQNKLVKRTIIVAILIGLLLPIKILKPLTEVSQDTKQVQKEIQTSLEKKDRVKAQEMGLKEMERTFHEVQTTIAQEPWNEEKDRLIQTYREMRLDRTRIATQKEIQAKADKTIYKIGDMVRDRIIGPLAGSLPQNPKIRAEFRALSNKIDSLKEKIKGWESSHIGVVWYQTLTDKGEAMDELTLSLRNQIREVPALLQTEQEKIEAQRNELTTIMVELEKGIEGKEKQLEDLEKQMQQILPGWLRGIVRINEMIQIFPALLLILTLYVFWLAISLTRHYNFVAREVNLKKDDKKDPSTSSIWTLTNRGQVGTMITVTSYLIFTILMWVFFEWGHRLLVLWMTPENCTWYGKIICSDGFLWFGRIILTLCFILIVCRKTFFDQFSQSFKNLFMRKPAV